MMKNILIFISLVFAFSCKSTKSIGQDNKISKKAETTYNEAQQLLFAGKHEQAINNLKKVLNLEPNYVPAYQQIGQIYQTNLKDYTTALAYYNKVRKLNSKDNTVLLPMAICHFMLNEFKASENLLKTFLDSENINLKNKQNAEQLLRNARFAEQARKNPEQVEFINVGNNVNTENNEYFPSITSDNETLYFTRKNVNDIFPNEDIYKSNVKDNEFELAKRLSSTINTKMNEGAHCINSNGKYLLFASNNYRYGNEGRFDIYLAKKVGDKFKTPVNLGRMINSRNWDSQPMLTANGRQILFVSNRKDGLGGSDIYLSELTDEGTFSKARLLSDKINTPFNEQRPFLHPDGKTLYFASSGHAGLGGSDLFKSTLQENGEWSTPVNLGYPINSSGDEFGIFVSSDGKTAYISSDREGGFGGQDIYRFELPQYAQANFVNYIKGTVRSKADQKPVQANIKIINLNSNTLFKSLASDELNGSFLSTIINNKNYAFVIDAEGFLPFSENISVKKLENNESFGYDVLLEPIAKGKEFTLNNIFFETNAYTLKENSKAELDFLTNYLKKNKLVYLEIGGHTDDVGSETANKTLSENRAKSVYDYLIQKGIATNRITYKGYGESKPVVENTSKENRAKNRRTSFIVL